MMKQLYHLKKRTLLLFFILANFGTILSQPTITSFNPTSGVVGTTVTITGTNFNTTAASNIVFFGATMATVTAATANSLTVTVPSGATYQPISVTNLATGLTAYSTQPFLTTYNGGFGFAANSFAAKVDYATGNYSFGISISDLDGDAKPDIAVTNYSSSTVSVFRNISTSGTASFATKVDYATGTYPSQISIGDLDGDGKPDLAVTNNYANSVSVLRNTSTIGIISFAAKVDYATGSKPEGISIGDLDGDGKPDLAVTNWSSNTISILRNISTIGIISFAVKVDYPTGTEPQGIAIADLDEDGKPDLAVTNITSNTVSVFRNTSISGSVSLATKVDYSTGTYPYGLSIGDLDGDGKPDIAVANSYASSNTISILRNTSINGTVSFAAKVDFVAGLTPTGISICDMDGDGRPDLAVSNNESHTNTASVLRNISTNGSVSFSAKVDYATVNYPFGISIGDLDGDNKPDLAVSGMYSVSILRRTLIPSTITSFTPTSGATGATVTITGTNFTGASAVSFGGTAASSFTVVSATTISAVVASGSSGDISVTTPGGTATLAGFSFIPAPSITSFTPTSGTTGTTVTITGTNFTGATAVSFGGTMASSYTVVSATSITAIVAAGTSGDVSITTPGGTATKAGFSFIPAPTITSFTPSSGATGTTITITGTNFTGATAVSFGGTAASSFTVVSATSITALVAAGTTGNISVTTPGGTANMAGFTFTTSTGINDISGMGYTISPNPATDYLHIKTPDGKAANVKIFSITGALVLECNVINEQISVQGLKQGLYNLKIGNQTFKLIKQ